MYDHELNPPDIQGGVGPVSALHITSVPKPAYTPTQALVKVKAFGLNRMDLLQREGRYPVPAGASKILGVEFSGTVEELGEKATGDFKVGDEVFGLAYGGAYAEFIAVSTKMLVKKPAELSWEECAGIPEVCSFHSSFVDYFQTLLPIFPIPFHSAAPSIPRMANQYNRPANSESFRPG